MSEYCLLDTRVCNGVTDTNIMWMLSVFLFETICVYVCSLLKLRVMSQSLRIHACLTKGQIVVCPVTLRRKEIQEWGREYWWVSRSLMTARKIVLVLWLRTWKKTVSNDRAGIKHLTLKFRGPMGLGGMNKWKNELLKEHWPKTWMCSSHVVMVCYCCWNCQEESVKKRRYLLTAPPYRQV